MFDALDVAFRFRDGSLIILHSMPLFDPYRADPRFRTLLAKMKMNLV